MKQSLNWHSRSLSLKTKIVLLKQYRVFYNNSWIQDRMRNLHLHTTNMPVPLAKPQNTSAGLDTPHHKPTDVSGPTHSYNLYLRKSVT